MATQAVKNTFSGGLDLDTSTDKYPNDRYLHSENFRVVTKDGRATGALEIIKGNKAVLQLPSGTLLRGSAIHRNQLLLFSVDDVSNYNGDEQCYIHIIDMDTVLNATSQIQIVNSYYFEGPGHLVYQGQLGFNDTAFVKAITNYENPDVQKVYFVTDGQALRQLNIVNSNTNPLRTLPLESLSLLPQFDINPNITLSISAGGNIPVGITQYFIQFYQRNGSQSAIFASPSHILISETSSRGSALGEFANRSVNVSFENQSTVFNRFRILAADYTVVSAVPSIRIVQEQELSVGNVSITDDGRSIGTVTAEELNVVPTEFFPETLETKDNILLLGNVREGNFEVTDEEFDARAFRYNSSGIGVVNNRTASGGFIGQAYSNPSQASSNVPFTHDAINRFNNISNDFGSVGNAGVTNYSTHPYFYQSDGSTVGGSGINISYSFVKESSIELDTLNTEARSTNPKIEANVPRCYQRGEVYRFGIVFFDKQGRQSFVKWIGDIRMPLMSRPTSSSNIDYTYTVVTGNGTTLGWLLYPRFQVNIPTALRDKISGYKIVRAERTAALHADAWRVS